MKSGRKGLMRTWQNNLELIMKTIFRIIAVLVLVIETIFLTGCSDNSANKDVRESRDVGPNILIIVSDALRADAMSCYGGNASTPNIYRLAKEGVLFENAYANAPWTLPSSVAMFTGNYPSAYGRITDGKTDQGGHKPFYFISDKEKLLAEGLKERGYESRFVLEIGVAKRSNIFQGFEDLGQSKIPDDERFSFLKRAIEDVDHEMIDEHLRSTLYYISQIKTGGGNFFLVHWFEDPHSFYNPPKKYKEMIEIDPEKLSRDVDFYSSLGAPKNKEVNGDLTKLGPGLNDYELFYLKELYSKEIESIDEKVGIILKTLEHFDLLSNTIIIFTSDHGEGFGEHGQFFHGNSYYNELAHIPLIISGPGIAKGLRIKDPVSHVDLMPTLKSLLDIDVLSDPQGKSFKSLLSGEKDSVNDRFQYIFCDELMTAIGSDALIDDNFKLILHSDDKTELYDLLSDPMESKDISGQNGDIVKKLKKKVSLLRKENELRRKRNFGEIDNKTREKASKETLKQLKALGYIN